MRFKNSQFTNGDRVTLGRLHRLAGACKIIALVALLSMKGGTLVSQTVSVNVTGFVTVQTLDNPEEIPTISRIVVYQDDELFMETTSSSTGSFYFALPIGTDYFVEWSRPGYTLKRVLFDLNGIDPESVNRKRLEYDMQVSLVETKFLTKDLIDEGGVIRVFWNQRKRLLDYESDKTTDYWDRLAECEENFQAAVQDSKSQRMSQLIHEFVDNMQWPNADSVHELAVVGDYSVFVNLVREQENEPKWEGIKIKHLEDLEDLEKSKQKDVDIVYVNAESGYKGSEVMGKMEEDQLLFTTGYAFHETMVNFTNSIYTTEFEINELELAKRGLAVSEEILNKAEFTRDVDAWRQVMSSAQASVRGEKERVASLETAKQSLETENLDLVKSKSALDQELSAKNDEIAILGKSIFDSSQRLKELDRLVAMKNAQMRETQNSLLEKQKQIELAESAVKAREEKLFEFNSMLDATTAEIKKAQAQLSDSARLLADQERLVWIVAAVAGLITILLIFAFRNYIKQRRFARENHLQAKRIEQQKMLLEVKNLEMHDSITYAKRIQDAMLPSKEIIDSHLGEAFILYQPKDIVAGDFFWIEKFNETVYFAVADCTGHGVPGALMSVVCGNALTRALAELGETTPGSLLNKTRELVVEQVAKRKGDVKDGMDIALCSYNRETNLLQYSGAHNPLWIVTDREIEHENLLKMPSPEGKYRQMYEIKADKQPVGSYTHAYPFSNHTIKLEEGDTIYLFSDGFADQFGGVKGKKLKYSVFKDLILLSQDNGIAHQEEFLSEFFVNWRGELEQIDDVCVLGMRV